MDRFLTSFLLRLYGFFVACVLVILGSKLLWRSEWHKDRLYQEMLSGPRSSRNLAAMNLVDLSAQRQLLRALHSDSPVSRQIAFNALWDLWDHAAGEDAFHEIRLVIAAAKANDYPRALDMANALVAKYPAFPEGWNRRATLLWEMGLYFDSIADCHRVLALNPEHFAAWQGLGLCQMHIGQVHAALFSFRAALRLNPHDPSARSLLKECEDYERAHPHGSVHPSDTTA